MCLSVRRSSIYRLASIPAAAGFVIISTHSSLLLSSFALLPFPAFAPHLMLNTDLDPTPEHPYFDLVPTTSNVPLRPPRNRQRIHRSPRAHSLPGQSDTPPTLPPTPTRADHRYPAQPQISLNNRPHPGPQQPLLRL
ncbi:hypothetical protein D9611_011786 [Ephemerocybe angulata]|uniref:Uncharacterized protein n=1 Tax=Ephemerocybe angulata TaxID=980116 RepID=A0A8H5C578_9AGAR|nr:hypothetical protein D9611_011786 [Tulosesus angulatus]